MFRRMLECKDTSGLEQSKHSIFANELITKEAVQIIQFAPLFCHKLPCFLILNRNQLEILS